MHLSLLHTFSTGHRQAPITFHKVSMYTGMRHVRIAWLETWTSCMQIAALAQPSHQSTFCPLARTDGQHHAPTTLDAGAFAGLMLTFFVTGAGSNTPGGGLSSLQRFGSAVVLAMESTPMRNGLPWSDPKQPCTGYGFTDTIVKTGNELYSSILFWDASRRLAAAFELAGNASAANRFRLKASQVEANFSSAFWNETYGMFMATTGLESDRIDVWGSAYAALAGLALPEQARRVANFLATNRSQIFFAGQTRQLPAPQVWSREFPGESKWFGPGRYQDGGYWGTPSHHTLPPMISSLLSTVAPTPCTALARASLSR